MNRVSEISRENIIQRVIRDNALAALMLVLALVTMINGIIIGTGIAVIINQGDRYDQLSEHYYINSIYLRNLHADLQAQNFEPPPLPEGPK